jgi:hypothetical protein
MLVAAMPAHSAAFYTGNKMMDRCKDTDMGESRANAAKYNACVGYLAGLWDATDAWVAWGRLRQQICVPKGVTQAQLRQVFLNYMNRRPAEWHVAADSLALNAFLEAWPCRQ